jgi:hypothetical protein
MSVGKSMKRIQRWSEHPMKLSPSMIAREMVSQCRHAERRFTRTNRTENSPRGDKSR